MWLPADRDVGSTWLALRSGLWKSWFRWGWTGIQRMDYQYTPRCEKVFRQEMERRGLEMKDAWYLVNICVDPAEQGRGYTSLLMSAANSRWPEKPMLLESSTPKSRDVYLHLGFELLEQVNLGRGEVTPEGVLGEDREGITLWCMIKV
ncbi:hypothetical protein DACRYDRAFT_22765 [Dacryopinax primogenitus]|uniref:Uncharacterized protein n=1 Tax=Dacryopinax primogenitus (strain DJM 731) TaxID=1858805 RepID=M5G4Y1_DACPD|nr:uncharacterized protein DACRYDRAFT_22765 [Dacryopinax primogenitus]EJU00912.1 hypothetical protein DACRYDRAFT_22765 [Dacryopinax primogenitus]